MADYHPLIARAVAGLEKNSGEQRRALYERARTALVAQLRGVVPALDESEITRERLALEEAIRKVEAESARHARETPRTIAPRRPDSARREEPQRSAAAAPRSPALGSGVGAPAAASVAAAEMASPAAPPGAPPPAPAPRENLLGPGPSRAQSTDDPPQQRERQINERPSLAEEAMKGFRDVAAEPRPAPRAAEPRPRPPVSEPRSKPRESEPRPMASAAETRHQERPAAPERPSYPQRPSITPPRAPGLPPAPSLPPPPSFDDFGQIEPRMQPEDLWTSPYDSERPVPGFDFDEQPQVSGRPRAPRQAVSDEEYERPARPPRSLRGYGRVVRIAVVLFLIALVGGLALWQREGIGKMVGSVVALVRGPSTPVPVETTAPARPKIADRLGQPAAPQPGGPPVAQRVVLYEEDPDDPQGKRFVGTVLWRTEMMSPAPGRAPELAVRADISVPERNLNMTWSLRRNTDQSLPASHTIEIMFNLPPDSPSGGVQNVPGVLMKQAEQTRGVPLAGLAVKVTPGFFLLGLSAIESDMQRNLQLLKERSWFDIPIVYNNNRRAILAMEKGTPGERAFAEAFAAWKQ
jgi:hypothetical protein